MPLKNPQHCFNLALHNTLHLLKIQEHELQLFSAQPLCCTFQLSKPSTEGKAFNYASQSFSCLFPYSQKEQPSKEQMPPKYSNKYFLDA